MEVLHVFGVVMLCSLMTLVTAAALVAAGALVRFFWRS